MQCWSEIVQSNDISMALRYRLKFVVCVYALQKYESHSKCWTGMLYSFLWSIWLGMDLMGMAAEPIHRWATPLFISSTDILWLEPHHLRIWDEWPAVAGILELFGWECCREWMEIYAVWEYKFSYPWWCYYSTLWAIYILNTPNRKLPRLAEVTPDPQAVQVN